MGRDRFVSGCVGVNMCALVSVDEFVSRCGWCGGCGFVWVCGCK